MHLRISSVVHFSVFLMVLGAFVAALDDLAFDLVGYTLVFLNNIFTSANGIVMKYKLESKSLGTFGYAFPPPPLSLSLLRPFDTVIFTYSFVGHLTPLFLTLFPPPVSCTTIRSFACPPSPC